MESSRRPRFKRVTPVTPIHLTDRDHQIIRLVHRHRFLRSPQISELLGDASRQILRRLQLLYHHGYLERPRAQIDYFHQGGGSRHIVYGLGNKGATLIKQELGAAFRNISWGEKNRAVGRIFLEHALLVSDVMVALELSCRKRGDVHLLTFEQLQLPTKKRRPFQWQVKISPKVRLGIIPDRVFGLEFPGRGGEWERMLVFLEADRGTMPVKRSNLAQTSFYRKLLAYEATWVQSLHRTRFGYNRFRLLTVTRSAKRVKFLVEVCDELKQGHGLFLFADTSILNDSGKLLPFIFGG